MLAKIGHGFAIANLESDDASRYHQLLPDLILGAKNYVGYVTGGDFSKKPSNPDPKSTHTLSMEIHRGYGKEFLVVNVRLFANWGAPIYHVVFGSRPTAT